MVQAEVRFANAKEKDGATSTIRDFGYAKNFLNPSGKALFFASFLLGEQKK